MIALLDGDLVAYRCAASCEKRNKEGEITELDPIDIAVLRADKLVKEILEAVHAEFYSVFLSGEDNFRKQIDPNYKANRKDMPKPTHLEALREFLVLEHRAKVQDGIEADDAMGIEQCSSNQETIVCSLDKDLLQIPGKHYQWAIGTATWSKEAKFHDITKRQGLINVYSQALIGDKSDNIIGVDKIGPVKAEKALGHLEEEQDMFDVVREKYKDDSRFLRNMKLLWIMREEGDIFDHEKRGLSL